MVHKFMWFRSIQHSIQYFPCWDLLVSQHQFIQRHTTQINILCQHVFDTLMDPKNPMGLCLCREDSAVCCTSSPVGSIEAETARLAACLIGASAPKSNDSSSCPRSKLVTCSVYLIINYCTYNYLRHWYQKKPNLAVNPLGVSDSSLDSDHLRGLG